MSVSIDDPEEGDDARAVLAGWLDDYAAGRCDRADMQASFLSVCRSNPEAPWDALALLDQYQRRGKIEPELARSLKSDIAQLVFGVANQTEPPRDTTEATLDTTGTRWRKLISEREIAPASAEDTSDLTAVRPEPRSAELAPRQSEPRPIVSEAAERPRIQPTHSVRAAERPVSREARKPNQNILRDRYDLKEVLGQGNSSVVYRALDQHRTHLPLTDRYVAVKVLKRSFAERAALAELEREFHQAQALSHPNVVSVFDLDKDGETYFIVMELLEGELLSSVLHRLNHEVMRRSQALMLIGAIGGALRHAHGRSVVHGDLKPANVMITSAGEIRVLGFGFARTRATQSRPNADAISTGAPAYASMERIHGQEADVTDDVYSFACIAYELLSGRHPYGGRSAVLARAHGKRPARIDGLSNKQWRALSDALSWDKAERRIDVADLITALGATEAASAPLLPQQIQSGKEGGSRGWGIWIALLLIGLAAAAATFFVTQVPAPPIDPAAEQRTMGPTKAREANAPTVQPPSEIASPVRSEQQSVKPATPSLQQHADRSVGEPAPKSDIVTRPAAPPPEVRTESTPQVELKQDAATPARTTTTPERSAPAATAATPTATAAPAAMPPSNSGAPTIEFEKDTYVATESDAAVRLVVKRSGSTRQAVKFRWALKSNSAQAGSDFADIGPGVEEIPAGVRSVHLTIPLVSDSVTENTELFLVELSTVDDTASLGEVSHAAVIIVDDD